MNEKENLLKLYKLYLYALQEREEHGEKYGDTDEIIKHYEEQLIEAKVLKKKKAKVSNNE